MGNFTWYSGTTLLGFLVSIALSLFIYFRVGKEKPHFYYAIIVFCMGVWCFDSFLVTIMPKNSVAMFVSRVFHLGGIYSSFFYVLWVFGVAKAVGKKYTFYKWFSLISAVILTAINFKGNWLIQQVRL